MIDQLVLVADDDPDLRSALEEVIGLIGHSSVVARNGSEAVDRLGARRPWVVVTDFHMAPMNGCQLIATLRERYPGLPAVVVTAHSRARSEIESLPAVYLAKPFGLDDLADAIAAATTAPS